MSCSSPPGDDTAIEDRSRDEPTLTTSVASPDFADPTSEVPLPAQDVDAAIEVSPIEKALGFQTDPSALSTEFGDFHQVVSEAISACMRAEGFSGYTHDIEPPPPPESFLIDASQTANLEQFGYGVTLNLRSGVVSLSAPEPSEEVELTSWERYLDKLDASAHDAFFQSLTDCADAAVSQHPPPRQTLPEQLREEISDLRTAARRSPEVTAAWDEWRRCLAATGYPVTSRDDIVALLEAEADPVRLALDETARSGQPMTTSEAQEIETLIQPIAAQEEQIAQTDVACVAASGVDNITRRAVHDAEQRWVQENGDRVTLVLAEGTTATTSPTSVVALEE